MYVENNIYVFIKISVEFNNGKTQIPSKFPSTNRAAVINIDITW